MPNEELAGRLGVGPSMASRIRNGQRLPSTRVLNRLHKEFGIPLEKLMEAHDKGATALSKVLQPYLEQE